MCGPASAHGGSGAAYTGVAGPYKVIGYDGRAGATPEQVEYRILLIAPQTQTPVNDATVSVRAELAVGDRHTEAEQNARRTANIYYFYLPRIAGATWRIFATIGGPSGSGTTNYFVHASAGGITSGAITGKKDSNTSRTLVIVITLVVVAAVAAAVVVRRRRAEPLGGR